MVNPGNDPAQLLASLLAGEQAMLQQFAMPGPHHDGKPDPA